MIDFDRAQHIHRVHYSEHDYTRDIDKYGTVEHWEPGLKGDCEDYAMDVVRAWAAAGADSDKCGLAYVKTNAGAGHCVAWITIDGTMYHADCNGAHLKKMDKRDYQWISYMRIHAPTHWYQFRDDA